MRQKAPRMPKARNNNAHTSLQNYFDRIFNSLEERVSEYLQMRKYIRVYEESQKLLSIEKALNIASSSIFEINIVNKLNCQSAQQIAHLLNTRNTALKGFVKGKTPTIQTKLLIEIIKHIQNIETHLIKMVRDIDRITEVIPVIKAVLKRKEKGGSSDTDPILHEIGSALKVSLVEPSLVGIKQMLIHEKIDLSHYDSKLNFEHINDVSDKLIGLLNDKLLLIIGISEFLIAGVEDEGANDVSADQRLPDELRVLFLASNTFDVLRRVKSIKSGLHTLFESIKMFIKIYDSDRLDPKLKALLKNGQNSVHELITSIIPKSVQRMRIAITEISPELDTLDLKLKIDTLDLDKVMNVTYGLIYEKSNRTWENPFENT